MNQSIETFVASCAPQIEDYWAKFEIYSFEYRHFIRSYAYKILLLIELKKCIRTKGSYRLHKVALVQRPADMFSGRVIRFSRARVLMLLTQLDSVFAHQIKPSKLRSYIELVRSNTELVSSILNQNASLQRVIVSAWNQLMPACRVVPNKKNIVSLQWFKASLV